MQRYLKDARATEALSHALAVALARRRGGVIYLEGELGAGKTTLVRAWLRALGVTGTIRSPTYTLMEMYRAGAAELLHLDLYRLADPRELHQLGLTDYPPEHTLWLVEWPDKGRGVLPDADICLRLTLAGEGRNVVISGLAPAELASIENPA